MGNLLAMLFSSYDAAYFAIEENEKGRKMRFEQAKAKCADLDEAMRKEILALNFFELKDALQSDKYNAKMVLKAYMWKALEVHERINCINECLVEAFNKADALDVKYGGKPNKPPLFGVPFSVKGNFFVKNYECCIGLSNYLGDPKKKDCTFVTCLQDLGAVPFVTTNVPETLLNYVCSNPVYGTTENPAKIGRTPGGSSGGEAALLASFGSSFGTGSDVAGSIRIPAALCGLVSLKPSEARVYVRNCHGGIPGKSRLSLGTGFFTHTVDENIFLMAQSISTDYFHQTSPKVAPIPFRMNMVEETIKKAPLRIGYFVDDGFLKPVPGCARVVNETVAKLTAMGHELIPFTLPKPYEAAELCFKTFGTDSGYLCKLFNDELPDKYMSDTVSFIKLPFIVRSALSVILGRNSPQAKLMIAAYCTTIEELRVIHDRIDVYTDEFFDLWNENKLDALICPGFPVPAIPHKYPDQLIACAFATAFWNMLDFPAGIVPIGKWTEEDERNLLDEKYWPVENNFILQTMREASKDSQGLPLGIQVVSKPYNEEVCLGVMKVVENAWKQK